MELNSNLLNVDIETLDSREEVERFALNLKGWAQNLNDNHIELIAKHREIVNKYEYVLKISSDIERLTKVSRSVEFFDMYREHILKSGSQSEIKIVDDIGDMIVSRFRETLAFVSGEIERLNKKKFELDVVEFREFQLNLKTRVISNDEHVRKLTKSEFAIVKKLCDEPNKYIDISKLASHPPSVISRLKKKMPFMECIQTEKGVGTRIQVEKKIGSIL